MAKLTYYETLEAETIWAKQYYFKLVKNDEKKQNLLYRDMNLFVNDKDKKFHFHQKYEQLRKTAEERMEMHRPKQKTNKDKEEMKEHEEI